MEIVDMITCEIVMTRNLAKMKENVNESASAKIIIRSLLLVASGDGHL